jgi:hypothetical protein
MRGINIGASNMAVGLRVISRDPISGGVIGGAMAKPGGFGAGVR